MNKVPKPQLIGDSSRRLNSITMVAMKPFYSSLCFLWFNKIWIEGVIFWRFRIEIGIRLIESSLRQICAKTSCWVVFLVLTIVLCSNIIRRFIKTDCYPCSQYLFTQELILCQKEASLPCAWWRRLKKPWEEASAAYLCSQQKKSSRTSLTIQWSIFYVDWESSCTLIEWESLRSSIASFMSFACFGWISPALIEQICLILSSARVHLDLLSIARNASMQAHYSVKIVATTL